MDLRYYQPDLMIKAAGRYPTLNMTNLEVAIGQVQHNNTDLRRRCGIQNRMVLEGDS